MTTHKYRTIFVIDDQYMNMIDPRFEKDLLRQKLLDAARSIAEEIVINSNYELVVAKDAINASTNYEMSIEVVEPRGKRHENPSQNQPEKVNTNETRSKMEKKIASELNKYNSHFRPDDQYKQAANTTPYDAYHQYTTIPSLEEETEKSEEEQAKETMTPQMRALYETLERLQKDK